MSEPETTRAAVGYAVARTVAALLGGTLVLLAAVRWLLPGYARYLQGDPTGTVLRAAAPGLAVALVGVLVYAVADAVVNYRALSSSMAAETAERLNTEAMKSDILAVMDERLADMKRDTLQTRRVVERMGSDEAADEFDFTEGR